MKKKRPPLPGSRELTEALLEVKREHQDKTKDEPKYMGKPQFDPRNFD